MPAEIRFLDAISRMNLALNVLINCSSHREPIDIINHFITFSIGPSIARSNIYPSKLFSNPFWLITLFLDDLIIGGCFLWIDSSI